MRASMHVSGIHHSHSPPHRWAALRSARLRDNAPPLRPNDRDTADRVHAVRRQSLSICVPGGAH